MADIEVAPSDAAALMEHFLAGMIFTPHEDLDTALEEFINPAYTQVTDGVVADRDEFVAHMAHLRGAIAGGHVLCTRRCARAGGSPTGTPCTPP